MDGRSEGEREREGGNKYFTLFSWIEFTNNNTPDLLNYIHFVNLVLDCGIWESFTIDITPPSSCRRRLFFPLITSWPGRIRPELVGSIWSDPFGSILVFVPSLLSNGSPFTILFTPGNPLKRHKRRIHPTSLWLILFTRPVLSYTGT